MIWILLAFLGAFFDATYYALIKKLMDDVDSHVLASAVFIISSIVLLILSAIKGFPLLGSSFYSSLFASSLLNFFAAILYFKALKTSEISITIPVVSFTPFFLIFTSFIILGESPSLLGLGGIFLVVYGSLILYSESRKSGLAYPLKNMLNSEGARYMMVVAFLFSLSANYDKLVVINSDPIFGSSMIYLFIGSMFLFSAVGRGRRPFDLKTNYKGVILTGIVLSLMAISINTALTLQIVPYVISLKRLNILLSVLYGGWIFKERNIARRLVGAILMLFGVILIII